jgi:branched-chain amino acid transport system ATP-binding protein
MSRNGRANIKKERVRAIAGKVAPRKPASDELLRVDGIDAFYGPVQALRNVSLSIGQGEKIALLGANGAGKTTTLRAISGIVAPASGEISFGGKRTDRLPAHKVVGLGVAHLPEGRQLFSGLSVEENLKFGYYPRRRQKNGSLTAELDRVMGYFPKLRERRKQAAGTLSGGEQQMLGVARALMSAPKLLLVDELSLGLAPIIVADLFDILDEVNKTGTAILIVEQFVHLALKHTDRAYVLQKGEVATSRPSSELLGDESLVESYLGKGV